MSEQKKASTDTDADVQSQPFSLRQSIRTTRQFLTSTISTARAHSPFADEKLEAADDAVAGVIHTGYQAVKNIVVNGHPAAILTCAGIATAAPSVPFGPRATVRNTALALTLAAVMIYPDHLKYYVTGTSSSRSKNE